MTTSTVASSPTACDDLITGHLSLAKGLARRFVGRGETLEDLQGVALLALVKAAQRYDPGREVTFATFATVSIVGELKRHFRDRVWLVRVPRRLHDRFLEIGQARNALELQHGRAAGIDELATHLRCSEEDILEAIEAGGGYRPASLEACDGSDGRSRLDSLGAEDPGLDAGLDRADLAEAATVLSAEDRRLLRSYFFYNHTQAQIGEELACSQMQVSRLLAGALARLRCRMNSTEKIGS